MQKCRILIVEDETDLAESLKQLLIDNYSHIDTAMNGQEALTLLEKEPYDLIISDILMPIMSGHDLIRRLRLKGIHTPVIFMTGNGTKDLVQSAIKLGAVDFIDKPVTIGLLKEVIASTLEIEQHKKNILDLQRDSVPDQDLIRSEEMALGIKQVSRDKKK
jgi:two-component system response regulator PilR (NtrC family)